MNCRHYNDTIEHLIEDKNFPIIWFGKLTRESAMKETGLHKLQTYRKCKQSILTELYVIVPLSKCQISDLAKFCCGVVPLRIETGRYTKTPEEERLALCVMFRKLKIIV